MGQVGEAEARVALRDLVVRDGSDLRRWRTIDFPSESGLSPLLFRDGFASSGVAHADADFSWWSLAADAKCSMAEAFAEDPGSRGLVISAAGCLIESPVDAARSSHARKRGSPVS